MTTSQITGQAIKNANSAMYGFGLHQTLLHTKVPSKTRFYATAIYHRNGFETVIDFSFSLAGKQMSTKVIVDNRYLNSRT